MLFEYILYVFIGIGFVMGFIRGWKKEICALISLLASLLLVLNLYEPLIKMLDVNHLLANIYEIELVSKILGIFGITYNLFEFIICGVTMFLLCFAILSKVFNTIFFSAKRTMDGKNKESNKFLGGLIGLLSGVTFGIFMMLFFGASDPNLKLTGYVTPFVLRNLAFFSDMVCRALNSVGVLL